MLQSDISYIDSQFQLFSTNSKLLDICNYSTKSKFDTIQNNLYILKSSSYNSFDNANKLLNESQQLINEVYIEFQKIFQINLR
jgi:hypothetical protein